ncbi:MAG: hypothetical protein ACK5JQ_07310 [Bacteroidota bacterium]
MNWETCRAYGRVEIKPQSNCIFLYYNQHNYSLVTSPNLYMEIQSAQWQGNNLLVRGISQNGLPLMYVFEDFYRFHQVA